MIIGTLPRDEEDVCDALVEEVMSPQFGNALVEHWRSKRFTIPLRSPEVAYTDETAVPRGYPCFEFVVLVGEKDRNSPMQPFEISCQITVNGDDLEVMGRELKRYVAVTRKYFDGRSLVPLVGSSPVQVGRTDYGPITGRTGASDFVKTAIVSLHFDSVV